MNVEWLSIGNLFKIKYEKNMEKSLVAKLAAGIGVAAVAVTSAIMFWPSEDYLSVIPGNSVMVAKVDLGNLIEESDVLNDSFLRTCIESGIDNMDGDARQLLTEMCENPNACGLDVEKPVYFAIDNAIKVKGVVTASVDNEDNLYKTMELLVDETKGELELSKRDGMTTMEDSYGNTYAAFDSEKMVIAFSEKGKVDVMDYICSKKKGEMSDALEDFIKDESSDISLYVDCEQLVSFAQMAVSQEMNIDDFKSAKLTAMLNFEKGKATLRYKLYGYDKFQDVFDQMIESPDNDLLDYLPEGTWAVGQLGIGDLQNIVQLFEGDIKTRIDEYIAMCNEKLEASGVNASLSLDLLSSIKGDMIFGATPTVSIDGVEEPQFVFIAECRDKKLFDAVAAIANAEDGVEMIGEDLYSLGLNKRIDWDQSTWHEYVYVRKGYDYYLGYVDDKMYVMPENLYAKCVNGLDFQEFDNSLKDNKTLLGLVDGKNAVAVSVADLVNAAVDLADNDMIRILNNFKSVSVEIKSAEEAEYVVCMTDKDTEFLKQIIFIGVKYALSQGF